MTDKANIVFIPHGGGPMPLLDEAAYHNMNEFLRGLGAGIEKPDAILVISAHWEESVISITASPKPPMLFDYYNFPPESYQYSYPAPGQPELASRIQSLLGQADIEARLDRERGFDHGVFIPLMLMYPEADIPCIQLSLSASLDAAFHIRLGQALRELRKENLLILGSGFSFHNLRIMMNKNDTIPDEKNLAFENWLAQTCSDHDLSEDEREQRLSDWELAPHARYCQPREDHLLPLHVCYGVAGKPAETVFQEPVTGFLTSAYHW